MKYIGINRKPAYIDGFWDHFRKNVFSYNLSINFLQIHLLDTTMYILKQVDSHGQVYFSGLMIGAPFLLFASDPGEAWAPASFHKNCASCQIQKEYVMVMDG